MTTKQAVRILNKLWAPVSWQLALGADADAGFDGGEWSGPAHGELEESEYLRLLNYVAVRVGVTADQLDQAIQQDQYETQGCWEDAMHKRAQHAQDARDHDWFMAHYYPRNKE